MEKIQTDGAPEAIGPYSQAIVAGDFMCLSGQIAINPLTGKLVEGDIKEQTTQVLENIRVILKVKEITFSEIVKTEISAIAYLK